MKSKRGLLAHINAQATKSPKMTDAAFDNFLRACFEYAKRPKLVICARTADEAEGIREAIARWGRKWGKKS